MAAERFLHTAIAIAILLLPAPQVPAQSAPERRLAVTWDDPQSGDGVVRAMSVASPWNFVTPLVFVGPDATLRSEGGKVYAVSGVDDTITVIGADSWEVEDTFVLPPASGLQDIAVVGNVAYLTRANAAALLRLDLDSGVTEEIVDLSFLADADGNPDLGMMALHSGRLFIQVRRIDSDGLFSPPAYLAVVDVSSEGLVDADPDAPGIQAIELEGTFPKLKMQTSNRAGRLYVGATGGFFDEGGIEEIDTAHLRSRGLVIREADGRVGADLASFVFVKPNRGFLVFSTDLTISSHFHPFSTSGEIGDAPFFARVDYTASVLAFDRKSGVVFYPDGPGRNAGVLVVDARTGAPLVKAAVPTDATPTDFTLVLPSGHFQ